MRRGTRAALAVGALGVVYGDIGTSPLYALKESFGGHGLAATHDNVLGVLSLVVWALILVISVKYLVFVLRADNRGEGGVLAFLGLVPDSLRSKDGRLGALAALILVGAGLLYGDGLITPAISVLSAVEGLEVATPTLKPLVVPITCAILFGLFLLQKRGTAGIGQLFGPVMIVWFGALGALGVAGIVRHPAVLGALSPHHAVHYLAHGGWHGFLVLGGVVLAITGGEALYADMGHFGRAPIRLAWYGLVQPALLVNYLGQGAIVLENPAAIANPFYSLVPAGAWTYALVILATTATIIASQALISGIYSLTHQAIQLGLFPRVTVVHTSHHQEGQIYLPEINWALALGCVILVLAFGASSKLAAAYGIAVTGTMAITSIGFYVVCRKAWRWPQWKALPLLLFFLALDLPFFVANAVKFFHGGYVPIAFGAAMFFIMSTWKRGRTLLGIRFAERALPADKLLALVADSGVVRIPGACVFMASASHIPPILVHHLKHNGALRENVILLTVILEHGPKVAEDLRLEIADVGEGFRRLTVRYGYMEDPDIPAAVALAVERYTLPFRAAEVTYYLGRETLLATNAGKMRRGQELFFSFLSRNALGATAYFRIPPEQVVELGMQLDL